MPKIVQYAFHCPENKVLEDGQLHSSQCREIMEGRGS